MIHSYSSLQNLCVNPWFSFSCGWNCFDMGLQWFNKQISASQLVELTCGWLKEAGQRTRKRQNYLSYHNILHWTMTLNQYIDTVFQSCFHCLFKKDLIKNNKSSSKCSLRKIEGFFFLITELFWLKKISKSIESNYFDPVTAQISQFWVFIAVEYIKNIQTYYNISMSMYAKHTVQEVFSFHQCQGTTFDFPANHCLRGTTCCWKWSWCLDLGTCWSLATDLLEGDPWGWSVAMTPGITAPHLQPTGRAGLLLPQAQDPGGKLELLAGSSSHVYL